MKIYTIHWFFVQKSVVRLTDCPGMTLDVYRGRKTTMQQQQQPRDSRTSSKQPWLTSHQPSSLWSFTVYNLQGFFVDNGRESLLNLYKARS